ncbi:MAG: DUF2147 domain-containing protein [Acetobacteraceae bacterium]|nr:DUF2147 domain-containing protein [Acetobacteraceae bacterium]
MIRALILIGALAGLCGIARAEPPPPASVEGLWLVQDRDGVVAVRPCGDGTQMCGWIVGNDLAPGEPMPLDPNGQPHCGLQIIFGMKQIDPGVWDGNIRDPRDGKVYSARMRLDDEGRLLLRGYVLVPLFGSTQTWTRWPGTVTPECKMVPRA